MGQAVAVVRGLTRGGFQGDHDVAQFEGFGSQVAVVIAEVWGQRHGGEGGAVVVVHGFLGGEGQHIGGALLLAPILIELGDLGIAHQAQAQAVGPRLEWGGEFGLQLAEPMAEQVCPGPTAGQGIYQGFCISQAHGIIQKGWGQVVTGLEGQIQIDAARWNAHRMAGPMGRMRLGSGGQAGAAKPGNQHQEAGETHGSQPEVQQALAAFAHHVAHGQFHKAVRRRH